LDKNIQNKRATIKDIAKIAGVSISTVSMALNKKEGLADTTRFKVLAIAEKLNYKPNAIAKGLVTKKLLTIGLIISDITDPFFADLARGVEDESFKKGYFVILCNSDNQQNKEELYVNLLMEQSVAGLIVVPVSSKYDHLMFAFNVGIPVVTVDRKIAYENVSYITSDNFKGAYEVTKHLIELGHKQIACVTMDKKWSTVMDRIEGFKAAINEHHLPIDESLILYSNGKIDGAIECTRKLLSLKNRPTAIFGTSDIVAFGIIEEIINNNLRVPEDISVAGFDNIHYSAYFQVPLTTVEQPKHEMGKLAFNLLLKKIEKISTEEERIILPTKLVVRRSTANCLQIKEI